MPESDDVHSRTDPSGTDPSAAGTWDYWLRGTHYWPVEQQAGDEIAERYSGIRDFAENSRAWLPRAVRHAVADLGIRQILDVGAGLPSSKLNTHEVAERIAPDVRTLYVDIDPRVVLHQEATAPSTHVAARQADMRDTDTVMATAGEHLDLSRPVALLFSDCLGHLHQDQDALGTVHRLCAGLPSGSYLLLSHSTTSSDTPHARVRFTPRSPAEITEFFSGLELEDPGVVSVQDWRPDSTTPRDPALHESTYAGVARIP